MKIRYIIATISLFVSFLSMATNIETPTVAAKFDNSSNIDSASTATDELAAQIIDYAGSLVGKPYLWGATGPKAYDCSGFTSHVFKNFGLELSRTSRSQFGEGSPVELEDVQPGDLLFFGGRTNSKNVGHVGIATEVDSDTGNVTFIHSASSNGVRYDNLQDSVYFNKRYIGARRVIDQKSSSL